MTNTQTIKEQLQAVKSIKDKDHVASLLFTADAANKASITVWSSLCLLVVAGKVDSMESLSEYIMKNFPETLLEDAPAKKDGTIKFRTWETTKNLWKYGTTLFKAIEKAGSQEAVLPIDKPVPTLSAVKKIAYEKKASTKTDYEKFMIAVNTMNAIYNKLDENEQTKAKAIMLDLCPWLVK